MKYEKKTTNCLKKEADKLLREYLLKYTEKINGKYFCPLKKKYYDEKQMDVAHFIDRGIYHLRWDLRNVHLISRLSNRIEAQVPLKGFKSLHHKEYGEYLKEKGYFEDLIKESKERRVLKREDIIHTIEFLRNGINGK